MRKPVKQMNHNKKSKPKLVSAKPKLVSAKPKPKPKTAVAKPKQCKPCKPQQHIYHHVHHNGHGEDIGNFGLSDLAAMAHSVKDKIMGHPQFRRYEFRFAPQPQQQPNPQPQPPIFPPKKRVTNPQKFKKNPNQPLPPIPKPAYQPPPIPKKIYPPPTYTPPAPQPPQQQPTLGKQWKDAIVNAGQTVQRKAAQAVTPQGAYNIAKAGATGAYNAGKFAVNESYKGMEWLDKKRLAAISEQERIAQEKQEAWNLLPYEEKKDILQSRYMEAEMRHKLKRMRQQAEEYQLDKADAYLSGRRFSPKVFKVTGENSWDEKYMDEYGRELPGYTEEVTKRSSRPQRSESEEINDIFGFGSGVNPRSIPSPLVEPQRQLMGADEGVYDQPRRRTRYASEPPQQSSQRRINSISPQREADDLRRLLM